MRALQWVSQEGADSFGNILTDDVLQLASFIGGFARGKSEGLCEQAFPQSMTANDIARPGFTC